MPLQYGTEQIWLIWNLLDELKCYDPELVKQRKPQTRNSEWYILVKSKAR